MTQLGKNEGFKNLVAGHLLEPQPPREVEFTEG